MSSVCWSKLRLSFSFLIISPLGTKEFKKLTELDPCKQHAGDIAVVEYAIVLDDNGTMNVLE